MDLPDENKRVLEVIKFTNDGNELQFSKAIGVSQPRINRLFSIDKRSNKYPLVSFEIVQAIINKFLNIDADWLLTGKGGMLRGQNLDKSFQILGVKGKTKNTNNDIKKNDDKNDDIFETKPKIQKMSSFSGRNIKYSPEGKLPKKRNGNIDLVPYYDTDFAAGGSIATFEDVSIQPAYYMDIPEFSGCTAFRAYSDSMEKLIKSGSVLFGTKIETWLEHLEYGQIYGIICNDGRRYLKYIRRADKHLEQFLLKSENEDYDDFDMPKSAIRSIWLIHGWLNKRT